MMLYQLPRVEYGYLRVRFCMGADYHLRYFYPRILRRFDASRRVFKRDYLVRI